MARKDPNEWRNIEAKHPTKNPAYAKNNFFFQKQNILC